MGRPSPTDDGGARPWGRWARRLLPWASLAGGILSAVLMDRSPGRAWIVAVAAGSGWLVLIATLLVFRMQGSDGEPARPRLLRAARFGAFATKQSLIQVSLFFVIPFYWQASAGTPAHWAFVAVLATAAALASWDPILERLLARPSTAMIIEGISSFAGLAAVLPMLGLSNRVSLWLAAAGTATTVPLVAMLTSPRALRVRTTLLSAVAGLAIAGGLVLGLAAAIPAAPLRLVRINIGTTLVKKTVFTHHDRFPRRPGQLVCATSIWGPLGLRDELLHVWDHDGDVTDRIPLVIRGGRDKGFRTWSIKRNFGREPAGTWTCTVVTASGQRLGSRSTVIAR